MTAALLAVAACTVSFSFQMSPPSSSVTPAPPTSSSQTLVAASRDYDRSAPQQISITTSETGDSDYVDAAGYSGFPAMSARLAQAFDQKQAAAQALAAVSTPAQLSLAQFMSKGAVNSGGHKFTYYSQSVLPGSGLAIPGRHVNDAGFVCDADGYIVLAGSAAKGTVYDTPFGAKGKIYDRGTVGNHLDVYIR